MADQGTPSTAIPIRVVLVNTDGAIIGSLPVTIADNGDAVLGALSDAPIITDASGTINAKLRGLVKIWTQYTWAFDYDANNNPIYMGRAITGSGKGSAVWQIRKVAYDANNNPTDMQYANGSLNYDQIWNSRAGLSYS